MTRIISIQKLILSALFLFYSTLWAQINWTPEDIVTDEIQSGQNPSLAIDINGGIHISYWNKEIDRLMYGYQASGTTSWIHEVVDNSVSNGYVSKIKVDNFLVPSIAYFENVNGQMQVALATKSSSSWSVTKPSIPFIDPNVGGYGPNFLYAPGYLHASIDFNLNISDTMIIYFHAIYQSDNPERYTLEMHRLYKDFNSTWKDESFGDIPLFDISVFFREWKAGAKYGEFCTLVNRTNAKPAIFTSGTGNGELYYFQRTTGPSNWDRNIIDEVMNYNVTPKVFDTRLFTTYDGISASESPDSMIHISFGMSELYGRNRYYAYAPSHLTLQYIKLNPITNQVDKRIEISRDNIYKAYTTLRAKNNDSLFMTYSEPTNNKLMLAWSVDSGNTWNTQLLANCNYASVFSPFEFYNDTIVGVYFDGECNCVKKFSKPVSDLTQAWSISSVTNSQKHGALSVSKIDDSGKIHSVYYDEYQKKLIYATKNITWSYQTIEVGKKYQSIELQIKNNLPVLVLGDKTLSRTRLMSYNGATWVDEVIDATLAGGDISCALRGDTTHIVYYNYLNGFIKYARRIGTGPWFFEFIENISLSSAGEFCTIDVDQLGLPYVAYYDRVNQNLKFAYKTIQNNTWRIDTVHKAFNVDLGTWSKIKVNKFNVPVIVYRNFSDNQILIAEKTLNTWSIDTVLVSDSLVIGDPLTFTIDDSNNYWIAYNSQSNLTEVRLIKKGFNRNDWLGVPINNNVSRIADVFDFHVYNSDLYFIGRKTKIGETGVGVLYSLNGANVNIEEASLTGISVYPNPFQDILNIDFENSQEGNLSIQITDLTGKVLDSKSLGNISLGFHRKQVDLSSLNSGLYFVTLKFNNQTESHFKIIKQ